MTNCDSKWMKKWAICSKLFLHSIWLLVGWFLILISCGLFNFLYTWVSCSSPTNTLKNLPVLETSVQIRTSTGWCDSGFFEACHGLIVIADIDHLGPKYLLWEKITCLEGGVKKIQKIHGPSHLQKLWCSLVVLKSSYHGHNGCNVCQFALQ